MKYTYQKLIKRSSKDLIKLWDKFDNLSLSTNKYRKTLLKIEGILAARDISIGWSWWKD
jgi:hypothetical protein